MCSFEVPSAGSSSNLLQPGFGSGEDPPAPPHETRQLVESCEPAVVFSSLARLCVPDLCDRCTIAIVDGAHARYRVGCTCAEPRLDIDAPPRFIEVSFRSGAEDSEPFAGTARFSWRTREPDEADEAVGSQLVNHAVALITRERLAEDAWRRADARGACRPLAHRAYVAYADKRPASSRDRPR